MLCCSEIVFSFSRFCDEVELKKLSLCRRLKPGGGGVNAAIFSAAGPALEIATKERAGSLTPGKAVGVPLPSTSPLSNREGVTHVIHVLGPNMNPQRPNCLNNDYIKGCKVLREAYSSLFEVFASIVRSQEQSSLIQSSYSDQKVKREGFYGSERNKKCKGFQDELGSSVRNSMDEFEKPDSEKSSRRTTKPWGPWAQALHQIAMHPESHKIDVIEISDGIVVLNDLYPKVIIDLVLSHGTKGTFDCKGGR